MGYHYDLIVIGAGSGGLAAATYAMELGKRVAIAEKEDIGGTCVNRGCIPTKLMVYAADFAKQQAIAGDYGWVNPEGLFDWSAFRNRVEDHVQSLRDTQEENLSGLDILRGQASFLDPHTVQVNDMKFTTEYVLIAVGARPRMPDLRGINHAISSRDIFHLETLPESFIVVGGGYIGVEFSQILKSFGCQVSLMESSTHVLDGFDRDLQTRVQEILEKDGVQVWTDARLESIEQNLDTLMAVCEDGRSLKASSILCALGRTANIDTLNLETVGVTTKENKIVVDGSSQTDTDNIFAVGDCTDRMLLTPVAKAEAKVALDKMFKGEDVEMRYRWVPSAVFMHPEVATVGLTEQEARQRYDDVEIHCDRFSPLKYAISSEQQDAFIKLVINSCTEHILGIHLIAPHASEIVQSLVPALKKGLTKQDLDNSIGIHPSIGEEIFAL